MPRFPSARSLPLIMAWLAISAAAAVSPLQSPDPAAAADPSPPQTANLTAEQTTATTVLGGSGALQPMTAAAAVIDRVANRVTEDVYFVDVDRGHDDVLKPMKNKRKKKPMSKHKKKKQSFKDKLIPLLIIPFAIQTMLIPMFIMNLKLLAIKAMTIGKFAILLIAFNMIRSWSQNAHSTSVSGSAGNSMLMAQNYGYNGGPELGALFNG
ncbi:Protein of unknown function DUF1676 [Cinara cedri]|uniref:Uncharacterized protein n=1 Tax=Cinara cedri TaxID=506608 RepID=A0A5E4N292_9HEMI|nr:Protein of unknown function DUF1676 [Cinara cedri]